MKLIWISAILMPEVSPKYTGNLVGPASIESNSLTHLSLSWSKSGLKTTPNLELFMDSSLSDSSRFLVLAVSISWTGSKRPRILLVISSMVSDVCFFSVSYSACAIRD